MIWDIEKPARLIIRSFIGFASDSVFVKPNKYWDGNAVYETWLMTWPNMCFPGRAHHIRPSPGTTCGACGIFQNCATTCQTTILCRGHLASEKFSNQFQSIDFPTLLPVCVGGSQSILKLAGFSIFCNFSTFLIFQQGKHHHHYHDHKPS